MIEEIKSFVKDEFPDLYNWYKSTTYIERFTALVWFNIVIVLAFIYMYAEYRWFSG